MRRLYSFFFITTLACAQQNLLIYRDSRGKQQTVHTPSDWEKRRKQILAHMQEVMGPLPAHKREPLRMEVLEEVRSQRYVRQKITYISEKQDRVPAYLFLPADAASDQKLPAMLCLHQTTKIGKAEPAGLGGNPNLHYAAELAELGYVALAPDYPNFGDYTFDPYANGYQSATMKAIFNHIRAVDLLQSLPQVDPKRIGAIGHSLGGHNTLFVGVFDQRIRVLVTSCGFNSFPKYKGGDLTGWSHRGYMPRIASVYEKSPAKMPFDFPEVLAALAPRPVFINAPKGDKNFEVSGVEDCVRAAQPVYDRIFHAPDKLVAIYPDAQHDFPFEARQSAYQFLNKWLKQQ